MGGGGGTSTGLGGLASVSSTLSSQSDLRPSAGPQFLHRCSEGTPGSLSAPSCEDLFAFPCLSGHLPSCLFSVFSFFPCPCTWETSSLLLAGLGYFADVSHGFLSGQRECVGMSVFKSSLSPEALAFLGSHGIKSHAGWGTSVRPPHGDRPSDAPAATDLLLQISQEDSMDMA